MKKRALKTTRLVLAMGAMVVVCASASESQALDQRQLLALPVMAGESDATLVSFGSLRGFLRQLHGAGRVCRLNPYAYGANLDCGPANAPDLLIGLNFAPTRAPEFLQVGSVRANGVNGGEMPRARFAAYLRDNLKISPARR